MTNMPLYILATTVSERASQTWPWYVIRGAGLMAVVLLFLVILMGIGHVTGLTYRWLEPIKAWAVHKALALMLLLSVFLHVFFLLIDKFINFSPAQVFVPFVSRYNNGTTLIGLDLSQIALGVGVIGFYILLIIIASSLGWIESKPKTWRWLHYASYVLVGLIFIHGAGVGTDLRDGWPRLVWLGGGAIIALGLISRLYRAGTLKK